MHTQTKNTRSAAIQIMWFVVICMFLHILHSFFLNTPPSPHPLLFFSSSFFSSLLFFSLFSLPLSPLFFLPFFFSSLFSSFFFFLLFFSSFFLSFFFLFFFFFFKHCFFFLFSLFSPFSNCGGSQLNNISKTKHQHVCVTNTHTILIHM